MPSAALSPLTANSVAEIPREMAIQQIPSGHLISLWFSFDGATAKKAAEASEQQPDSDGGTSFYSEHGLFNQVRDAAVSAFAEATGQSYRDIMVSERRNPDGSIWWNLVTRHPCPMPTPKSQKKLSGKKTKEIPAPKRSHHKKDRQSDPRLSIARFRTRSGEHSENSTRPRLQQSAPSPQEIPVTWGPVGAQNLSHLHAPPVAPLNETSASSAAAVSLPSQPATAGFWARWLRAARTRIRFWRK
jgi:hypothetical protein